MRETSRVVAYKIESFAVDSRRRLVFVGTNSGLLEVVHAEEMDVVDQVQVCAGSINAIAIHRTSALIACLGLDRTLTIVSYSKETGFSVQFQIDLRAIEAENDFVEAEVPLSDSQALAWHPVKQRIATRNATSALLEVNIDLDSRPQWQVVHCTRLHNDQDLVTVTYVNTSDRVLSGSIRGEICLSEGGGEVFRWAFGDRSVHWFEPLPNGEFLIASDMRKVGRLSLHDHVFAQGGHVTLDDLEHVTYLPEADAAFVCGFDKNIYRINPSTCDVEAIVCRVSFKARWMAALEWLPFCLLVQCYDGSINLIDVRLGHVLKRLHRTPDALWTAAQLDDGECVYAGEGSRIIRKRIAFWTRTGRAPVFDTQETTTPRRVVGYVKRMLPLDGGRTLALGCSEGELQFIGPDNNSHVKLHSAIRDICGNPSESVVYCVTESGELYSVSARDGTLDLLWQSETKEPLWALACCPMFERIVFAERRGGIFLLHLRTREVKRIGTSSRPKRVKWFDCGQFILNSGDALQLWDLVEKKNHIVLPSTGNTVEDFAWDVTKKFLVAINYCCDLHLVDIRSWKHLHTTPDQIDYSKGVHFITPPKSDYAAYPYHFVSYGRSGSPHLYRVHNDRIHSIGVV